MLRDEIFKVDSAEDFERIALKVFALQAQENPVYKKFISLLGRRVDSVQSIHDIPFMPISFFKDFQVKTEASNPEKIFTSSGTTGLVPSQHFVSDLEIYNQSFTKGFESFYGPIEDYAVLALLPSYLERDGSSLVYMAEAFIQRSESEESGFYLDDLKGLVKTLEKLEARKQKTLLLGVSFALLDLVEGYSLDLKHTIVMETGGMKGRRKELIREELHDELKKGFKLDKIHSEYGMTELLSQAYSKGDGIFYTPKWMKVLARDPEDALSLLPIGKSGGANIIDLANIDSCSFIATQDLCKIHSDGGFEILGRFDNSDIRGCNLLVQ
jgi:phenylacetate-coenzyme A ligase PaaK-like adenylate-forming protein